MGKKSRKNYLKSREPPKTVEVAQQAGAMHAVTKISKFSRGNKKWLKIRKQSLPTTEQSPFEFEDFKVRVQQAQPLIMIEICDQSYSVDKETGSSSELNEFISNSEQGIPSKSKQYQEATESQEVKPATFRSFVLGKHQNSLGKQIDLSYCQLKDLVLYCQKQHIINKEMSCRFQLYYTQAEERSFITTYSSSQKYFTLNFKFQLFTLLDHRLLASMLSLKRPDAYAYSLQSPLSLSKEATQFLNFIYSMKQDQYWKHLIQFNSKQQRFWMPESKQQLPGYKFDLLLSNFTEDFHQTSKNGRFLRRRAEN